MLNDHDEQNSTPIGSSLSLLHESKRADELVQSGSLVVDGGMTSSSEGAPQWAVGAISDLVRHVQRQNLGDSNEVDRLIALLDAAVQFWRTAPLRYVEHFGCFADFLYNFYKRGASSGVELNRAVELWQEASAIPGVSGLIANRLRLLGVNLDVEVARRDGGAVAMAERLRAHCAKLRGEFDRLVAPSLLIDLVRNLVRLSRTAADNQQWGAAADAGELAARTAAQLFRTVPMLERLSVIAEFRTVSTDAASALLRDGRVKEAVLVLEVARQQMTRFWRDVDDLERLLKPSVPALYERYRAAMEEWRVAASTLMEENDTAARQAAKNRVCDLEERAVAITREIQKLPGLERFEASPSFAEIRKAADPFPLLYVWSSQYDTALVVVLPDGAFIHSTHTGTTSSMLMKVLHGWVTALRVHSQTDHDEHPDLLLSSISGVLDCLIGGVLKELLTRRFREASSGILPAGSWRWGPVALVVSGPLSFVPMHVWTPYVANASTGEPTNHMPLMYVPSARAALRARRHPRPTGSSRRLLSIADPTPLAEGLSPLRCARVESTLVGEMAGDAKLLHGDVATGAAFMCLAAKYEVLHLACHARPSDLSAGGACLELGGGPVPAEVILRDLHLNSALVVLSACWSGEPDSVVPEESLDLGSRFLAAGARGVVANMWPVHDLAAALFVWHFFRFWNWGDGLAVHEAVHAARLWLRETTVAGLRNLAKLEPRWSSHIYLCTLGLPSEAKPFGKPYYWAAFAYSGG